MGTGFRVLETNYPTFEMFPEKFLESDNNLSIAVHTYYPWENKILNEKP
jgi:hypothetical protein